MANSEKELRERPLARWKQSSRPAASTTPRCGPTLLSLEGHDDLVDEIAFGSADDELIGGGKEFLDGRYGIASH